MRAMLELQRDLEASEEEAITCAADGTDDDDAIAQAGLRAKLDAVAAAKEHMRSLRHLSHQAAEDSAAELRAAGLHGVLAVGSLPPRAAAPPVAGPLDPEGLGLIDAGALMRRAVESTPPRWPDWGFPQAAHAAWEERLAAGLPGGGAAWWRGFVFTPGMLFGSGALWWRPFRRRELQHLGLDYAQFVDPSGGVH